MSIKRYDVCINGFESGVDVIEIGDGKWVKYDDVAQLIKNANSQKEDNEYRQKLQERHDELNKQK